MSARTRVRDFKRIVTSSNPPFLHRIGDDFVWENGHVIVKNDSVLEYVFGNLVLQNVEEGTSYLLESPYGNIRLTEGSASRSYELRGLIADYQSHLDSMHSLIPASLPLVKDRVREPLAKSIRLVYEREDEFKKMYRGQVLPVILDSFYYNYVRELEPDKAMTFLAGTAVAFVKEADSNLDLVGLIGCRVCDLD